jgi:hypothetical protein
MMPLLGLATFVIAATTIPVAQSPGLLSEPVARARLAKLGYPNLPKMRRNGDYWEATVTKNGVARLIRIHVLSGARVELPAGTQPLRPK